MIIRDSKDGLVWSKNHARGIYTPSGGYKALCEHERDEED